MKIALVLHGQPRNYAKGFEHLNRELISKYDCDVFGHTWWSKDMIGTKYDTAPWAPQNYEIENNLDVNLIKLYKFKSVRIESPKQFIPTKTYNVSIAENHDKIYNSLCSRFYSLKESIDLLQRYQYSNRAKYDFVILTRYDIGLYAELPNLNSLDNNLIYVSNMHENRKYVFNDLFWIVGKNIKVFKTIYYNLDKIYNTLGNFTEEQKIMINYDDEVLQWFRFNGEEIIATHLINNGIINNVVKDNRLNYNMIR